MTADTPCVNPDEDVLRHAFGAAPLIVHEAQRRETRLKHIVDFLSGSCLAEECHPDWLQSFEDQFVVPASPSRQDEVARACVGGSQCQDFQSS